MKIFRLHKDGNTWKYTLDVYKLRVCWRPIKPNKPFVELSLQLANDIYEQERPVTDSSFETMKAIWKAVGSCFDDVQRTDTR